MRVSCDPWQGWVSPVENFTRKKSRAGGGHCEISSTIVFPLGA